MLKKETIGMERETEDVTFEQTRKASGLSTDMSDYLDEDVAGFVGKK